MNFLKSLCGATLLAASASGALAAGWPANYEGVMLQGFYWDSYEDTKWTNLSAQADELSQYFKLIWIPNSGKCSYMGYMPQYWFTNHNSAFGTEAQLLSMISLFKSKGTGFIADCVINHRNGVTNWYDFPVEEWDGKTWKIGLEGICSNDEMAYAAGQPKPKGNPDTGENFDGCRDLDHTNANVQNNCKNYVKCLIEKYGYAGMRYDMVKGYGGQYNKIYNEYANVEYSVGEYWDGNYDAVAAWIESTGKTSAAFDFPLKYALNEAFSSNDMTKLVWKANGTTDQPAGLIHWGYPQYSVTFVDNHDTYRDGSKFTGNVIAANAFILMSPGTPCVFLPHYQQHKSEIQRLIEVRNAAGLNNLSTVKVLTTSRDCYMAEVTGSKGKVVVKVGSSMNSPAGYSNDDIKATGNGYCVWSKVNVNGGGGGGNDDPQPGNLPASLYVIGEVNGQTWSCDTGEKLTKTATGFTGKIEVTPGKGATDGYFSFVINLADDWTALNVAGNRVAPTGEDQLITPDGPAASFTVLDDGAYAKAFYAPAGTYTITVNWGAKTATLTTNGGGGGGNDDPDPVSGGTIYFHNSGNWNGIYVYCWDDNNRDANSFTGAWPGKPLTETTVLDRVHADVNGKTVYKYTLSHSAALSNPMVIFNSGASQTNDYCFVPNGVYRHDQAANATPFAFFTTGINTPAQAATLSIYRSGDELIIESDTDCNLPAVRVDGTTTALHVAAGTNAYRLPRGLYIIAGRKLLL